MQPGDWQTLYAAATEAGLEGLSREPRWWLWCDKRERRGEINGDGGARRGLVQDGAGTRLD